MHYIGDFLECQKVSNEFATWEKIVGKESMGFA